jgi:hypothetical protein
VGPEGVIQGWRAGEATGRRCYRWLLSDPFSSALGLLAQHTFLVEILECVIWVVAILE